MKKKENSLLEAIPNNSKIKKVVFSLNRDSACGADGISGLIYQSLWDIVGPDIVRTVMNFYAGNTN